MVGPVREHPVARLGVVVGVNMHSGSRRAGPANAQDHRALPQPRVHPLPEADLSTRQKEVPDP